MEPNKYNTCFRLIIALSSMLFMNQCAYLFPTNNSKYNITELLTLASLQPSACKTIIWEPGVEINSIIHQAGIPGPAFTPPGGTSPFAGGGTWEMLGGNGSNNSWQAADFEKSRSFAVYNSRLYVGMTGSSGSAAQIWEYNGTTWSKIAGQGVKGSWPDGGTYSAVNSMHVLNGFLYAGVRSGPADQARVWRYNGTAWTLMQDFPLAAEIWSMHVYRENLIIGTVGRVRGDASMHMFDGTSWSHLAGRTGINSSWGTIENVDYVYELLEHSDGYLYAGLGGDCHYGGSVWRYDGNQWERIGGNGIRNSWLSPNVFWVLSMQSYQGKLIISGSRMPVASGNYVSVWSFDGVSWSPIGADSVPAKWSEFHNFNYLYVYRDRVYVGAGGMPPGNASIFEFSNNNWSQVAGNGIGGSWSASGPMSTLPDNMEYIYQMTEYNGNLIIGFGGWSWRRPGLAIYAKLMRILFTIL